MTFEDIYSIFKLELDGEEFDTDDDAVLACNIAFREVLDDRDWKFLIKTVTLTAGTLSLASILDLDKVTNVYVADSIEPLKKATYENRFDTDYDYYIDLANNSIGLINSEYNNSDLIIDYKYYPADFTLVNTLTLNERLKPCIAYKMCLTYYRKDQDLSTYEKLENHYDSSMNQLIMHNENL
jgi:hypothetical protein